MSEELQELIDSNPEWYKSLQYDDVKSFIKANIESTSRSFIAIGYYLKYARDNELFKEDGYTGILEFAQSEFGISKSWASKWMSINDQFSVNGNSPILLEQYRDFTSGKLSEMLYLSEEQREQITVATTTAEIREIKSPAKEIKVDSFSSTKTEETPKHPLPRCLHKAGTECNILNAKEVAIEIGADCKGVCCWECKESCGARCNASAHRPEATEIVSIEPEENRIPDPDLSCKFDPEARCLVASKGSCKKSDTSGCMYYSGELVEDEYEAVETIEADIVQSEPEDKTPLKKISDKWYYLVPIGANDITGKAIREGDILEWADLRGEIKMYQVYYEQRSFSFHPCEVDMVGTDTLKMIPNNKLCTSRIIRNVHEGEEFITEETIPKPEQPELPILRNNDQRKEFIDAYATWPVWIDQELTGERYYRYDLSDKVAMVVKVSRKHHHEAWKETKDYEYGAEQYYLLGIKSEWTSKGGSMVEDDTRTFYECNTNKSSLIDYLKDFQKKK